MDFKGTDFSNLCSIAEQLDCYIWGVDHSNGRPQKFFSNSLEKLLGYNISELHGLQDGIISIISEEDRQKAKMKLTNAGHDQTINRTNLIYRIVKKDKTKIWIKEKLNIERNEAGKVLKTISLVFDINDVKEETTELNKSIENLIEMNSIKDKFISIVSHDLRAPFTTLLGFTEILLNEEDLPREERDEYLSYIYEASKSQLQMINYLVEWSRLQTGRTKIEPCRLNVKDIISNCVSTLTGIAIRKDLEIKTNIPNDLYVNADDRLISQAVINLISNAIKYSENGKKIQISSSKFKEGRIEIVVKDEGIGIPEEHQSKLFKIDFKYCIPGTKGEKGTGLGLALVKEIVEKHEGDIWFYSQVGEGSEFHFTIPEAKNIIMLVEDDEKRRLETKTIIENTLSEFEVLTVENGYKALNIAQEKIPSIIIINHDMPLMDGIQFVETMKNKSTLKNIPVVVLINNIDSETSKKYTDLKVRQLIKKSDEVNKLTFVIKENIV